MHRWPQAEWIAPRMDEGSLQHAEEAIRVLLAPHVRPFQGRGAPADFYACCQTRWFLAPPGHDAVLRAHQGLPPTDHHRLVVRLEVATRDTFLSTDRACLPASQRLPVQDCYVALLEGAPKQAPVWRLLDLEVDRRLVPEKVVLEGMAVLQESEAFQRILSPFLQVPAASRLVRGAGHPSIPRGIRARVLGRLLGRSLPRVSAPPPPRQLKFYLDRWLPPGEYTFGELFPDTRQMGERRFSTAQDALAFTVEFIEGTTPRHVHWRFRGTLLRGIVCGTDIPVLQRFRI